ncbi:MAG: AAA family ATPase, partial [Candidatus Aegiribacteria sp.]|nr:AAA family ATPase [Candidatus Aegiribacteria sp.]
MAEGVDKLDSFITSSLAHAEYYGSYCNGLFLDEKGLHMLMVFGAPLAYEGNARRGINYAIALRNDFGKTVCTGITSDTAYAGLVGSSKRGTYTVLGKAVNHAARLMQKSAPGEILYAAKAVDSAAKHFTLKEHTDFPPQGKTETIRCYCVLGKKYRPGKRLFEERIFGRSSESAQLLTNCESILKGRFAGITYVYGAAGIGKSRIVSQLQEQLEDRVDSIVLQCDSIHQNGFHPFIYGLKNYFHQSERNTTEQNRQYFEDNFRILIRKIRLIDDDRKDDILSELDRTKSFIAALLGYFQEDSLYSKLQPKARHNNTIAAIKAFLKGLSLIQPLVIIQEDLQWIDEDSQKTYGEILRNIPDFPIAVVAVSRYRDDFSEPVLNAPETTPVHVVKLKQISTEATKELINDRLGITAANELLELISKQAEGNPFYIEQFCMYLMENNLIRQSSLGDSAVIDGIEIPEGIRAIIVARLDRLTRDLRELVQNASVLGREFDIEVLSLMLESVHIGDLVREGESKAIWAAVSEMLYIFRHAMLQSVAYDMQLRKRQRELHGIAAAALEQLHAEDKTRHMEIAYHFEKAQNTGKAVEYLRKAYKHSSSEYKLDESRELLERLLQYPASKEDVAEDYSDLAKVCFGLGDWDSADKHHETSIRIADEAGLRRRKALYQSAYAGNLALTPDLDKAYELAGAVLIYGEKENDNEIISHALSSLGLIEQGQSKHKGAVELFERALDHARSTGLSDLISYSIFNLSGCYMMLAQNENAIELMEEGLALAEETNRLEYVAQFHIHLGLTFLYLKKYSIAGKHLDMALSVSKEIGGYLNIARALGAIGSLHFYMGDYSMSMRYLTEEVKICEECGNTVMLMTALYNLAETNIYRADYKAAEKQIARALGHARDRNDVLYEGVLTYLKARIQYEKGNYRAGTE